jgi:hypothetical protein
MQQYAMQQYDDSYKYLSKTILLPWASNPGTSIIFSGLQTRGSLVPFLGP